MQEGYPELIENVIETTKNMMGATEAAMGDAAANNTSAILVLQEASKLALQLVASNLRRCIGELATIWADMLCAYSPLERALPVELEGDVLAQKPDYRLLREELLHATATVSNISTYTPAATVALLDKLLENGHLSVESYLELLPAGAVQDREKILNTIKSKGA